MLNRQDRKRADAFIADFQASLYNQQKMLDLEEKLQVLDNSLGVHSPTMNGMPAIHGKERDERLADYAVKRERLMKEYDAFATAGSRVKGIIGFIPDDWSKVLHDLYGSKKTSEACAAEIGYTKAGMYYHMKIEILLALDDYYSLK